MKRVAATMAVVVALTVVATSLRADDWVEVSKTNDEVLDFNKDSVVNIGGPLYLAKIRRTHGEIDLGSPSGIFPAASLEKNIVVNCENKSTLELSSSFGNARQPPEYFTVNYKAEWEYSSMKMGSFEYVGPICVYAASIKSNIVKSNNEFANTKITDELCECYYLYSVLEKGTNAYDQNSNENKYTKLKDKSLAFAKKFQTDKYIKSRIRQQELAFYSIIKSKDHHDALMLYSEKTKSMCEYVVNNVNERYKFWCDYQGPGK